MPDTYYVPGVGTFDKNMVPIGRKRPASSRPTGAPSNRERLRPSGGAGAPFTVPGVGTFDSNGRLLESVRKPQSGRIRPASSRPTGAPSRQELQSSSGGRSAAGVQSPGVAPFRVAGVGLFDSSGRPMSEGQPKPRAAQPQAAQPQAPRAQVAPPAPLLPQPQAAQPQAPRAQAQPGSLNTGGAGFRNTGGAGSYNGSLLGKEGAADVSYGAPGYVGMTPEERQQAAISFNDRALGEITLASTAPTSVIERSDTAAAPAAVGSPPGSLPSADNPAGTPAPGRQPIPEPSDRLRLALEGITAANSGGGLTDRDMEAMQFYEGSMQGKELAARADENLRKQAAQSFKDELTSGRAFQPVDFSKVNVPISYDSDAAGGSAMIEAFGNAGVPVPLDPAAAAYFSSGDAGNMLGGRRSGLPGSKPLGLFDPESMPPLQPSAYTPSLNLGINYTPEVAASDVSFPTHDNVDPIYRGSQLRTAQMRNWGGAY